ncbi:MAG: IS4 family transposase [Opitutales bacterium]|nr:IS4 family transposase [Opitutales bacterium]
MAEDIDSDPFAAGQLRGLRLLETFRKLLHKQLESRRREQIHPSEDDPRRTLFASNYFSALLLVFYNPVLKSARAIIAASKDSATVRKALGSDVPLSLGSFSEAQHLFDANLLRGLIRSLRGRLRAPGQTGTDARLVDFVKRMIAVDSSFFAALDRISWAVYRRQTATKRVRLHLLFNVLDGTIEDAAITPGACCERKVLAPRIEPGRLYCGDRYYGLDYSYFTLVRNGQADALMRVRDQPEHTVLEEHALSDEARAYGVVADQTVILGPDPQKGQAVRMITLRRDGKLIRLVTTLTESDAVELCMLYRYRWEIETFFKWLKCILGTRGFLAESRNGITAQLYIALIMALMLAAFTGTRPNKRQMEAIQLYLMGWMTEDELAAALSLQKTKKS